MWQMVEWLAKWRCKRLRHGGGARLGGGMDKVRLLLQRYAKVDSKTQRDGTTLAAHTHNASQGDGKKFGHCLKLKNNATIEHSPARRDVTTNVVDDTTVT